MKMSKREHMKKPEGKTTASGLSKNFDTSKFIGHASDGQSLKEQKKVVLKEATKRLTLDIPTSVHRALRVKGASSDPKRTFLDLTLEAYKKTFDIEGEQPK